MSANIFTYRDDKTGFDGYMIKPYQNKINCPICNTKFISLELFNLHLSLTHFYVDDRLPPNEVWMLDKTKLDQFKGPTQP